MSVKERVARVTPRQWLAVAVASMAVVALVVWLVVAGVARAERAEAVDRYESVLGVYQSELARVKDDGRKVEGRLEDCRGFAHNSNGYVQQYLATCDTVENSIRTVLDYPDRPQAVLEDVEAATTDEIHAAAGELEEAVERVRGLGESVKVYDADIQGVIDAVQGEVREALAGEDMANATAAVARAREEISQTREGLVERSLIDDLAAKADELEAYVAEIEGRLGEIEYEEALDVRTAISGMTGELNLEAAKLATARTMNSVGGPGMWESGMRDRDQNTVTGSALGVGSEFGASRSDEPVARDSVPASQAASAPQSAPAPGDSVSRDEAIRRSYSAKPGDDLGGGWVDTSTGGNLCQQVDSDGNSWVGECP